MKIKPFNTNNAIFYAKKWALSRNSKYYNFDNLGGDCTNFISQCIFEGSLIMNYKKTFGWYYNNLNDRSPSWTGVEFLYDFLINNKSVGPFAIEVDIINAKLGDIVQFGTNLGDFYHTGIITNKSNNDFQICTHTQDSLDRYLQSYYYEKIRVLHIIGVNNY